MTNKPDVAVRAPSAVQGPTTDAEFTIRPAADIFENAECITLQLDMPGVAKDRLRVEADRNSLTVEGNAQFDVPAGMNALYADLRSSVFRRSFALSSELDVEKIDASLQDGVLTLRVPKRAEVRPRKIEVRAA